LFGVVLAAGTLPAVLAHTRRAVRPNFARGLASILWLDESRFECREPVGHDGRAGIVPAAAAT
jgi:hypothetical protein